MMEMEVEFHDRKEEVEVGVEVKVDIHVEVGEFHDGKGVVKVVLQKQVVVKQDHI